MFVHDYSNKEFKTYEECSDDLMEYLDEDDIVPHLEVNFKKVISTFLRNDYKTFYSWFQQELEKAITFAQDELITEYEGEEVYSTP